MFLTKLKTAAALLTGVVTLILAVGAGLRAQQAKDGDAGHQAGAPGRTAAEGRAPIDPAIKALFDARIATAREVFEDEMSRYEHTLTIFPDDTSIWSRRWMEDELRLEPAPAERLAAIQAHLERTRRLEKIADQYARAGQGRASDALKAKYFRLEAEMRLAEARATYADVPAPAPGSTKGVPDPVPQSPPPPHPR